MIVESASDKLDTLEPRQTAIVLGLAIALGGCTLTMLLQGVPQSPGSRRKDIIETLETILGLMLDYDGELAEWLPLNLHRLHEGSTILLNDHTSTNVLQLRLSSVTQL